MGDFKVTYYWPGEDNWGYQTATGVRSSNLYTVAVDPDVIPSEVKFLLMVKNIWLWTSVV